MRHRLHSTPLLTLAGAISDDLSCANQRRGLGGSRRGVDVHRVAVVNFLIDSDFKWAILVLAAPWCMALWLYLNERGAQRRQVEHGRDSPGA
jgi:hypothetical protein